MSNRATNDAWAATNVMTLMATRLVGSEQYLGRDAKSLGTRIGDDQYELFTICPPAEALALYFEQQQPTFIAVHDVGAASACTFVTGLSAALKQPLQRLTMRQQGSGKTLAQLSFIELPSARGVPVRVYSTSSEADGGQRRQIAETLLAFARLGVMLIGAPSEHLVAAQLGLLRDRVLAQPWLNRDLLLVPRLPIPRLDEQARRLTEGTLVRSQCTDPAATTAAIWAAVHAAWGRIRASVAAGATVSSTPPAAAPVTTPEPTVPAGSPTITLRSFGSPARPAPAATAAAAPVIQGFDAYAKACAGLTGVQACVVFDRADATRTLAQAGHADASPWLDKAAALLETAQRLQDALDGRSDAALDQVTTLDRQALMLRTLPRHPGLGMALLIDKALANPTLLREPLRRLDSMLEQ